MISRAMVVVARTWIRFSPLRTGKSWLWGRVSQRPHAFTVRTQAGLRMQGNTVDVIQRYLYYFGIWEPDVTAVLGSRLREGDVLVDIGANIGYYTLLGARLVGANGLVVAVEPAPKIMSELTANIRANNLTNVRTRQVALSDHAGRLRLFDGPPDNIGHTSLVPTDGPSIEVDVTTGAELLADIDPGRIRLIKVDVEGAELEALKGLVPVLERAERADVLLEVSSRHMPGGRAAVDEIFAIMGDLGFAAYQVHNAYEEQRYLSRAPIEPPAPLHELGDVDLADIWFTRDRG